MFEAFFNHALTFFSSVSTVGDDMSNWCTLQMTAFKLPWLMVDFSVVVAAIDLR